MLATREDDLNTLISDKCSHYLDISANEKEIIDKGFTLRNPKEHHIDFKMVFTIIVFSSTLTVVQMLSRTRYLGDLITTLQQLLWVMGQFFSTFGILILFVIFMLQVIGEDLQGYKNSFYGSSLQVFNIIMGNEDFSQFTMPAGVIYVGTFMFIFRILLMSVLAAMFINKYKDIYLNIDAHKRFSIIRMKNSLAYDKYSGGATLSFFPVNIIILPMMLPILVMRSSRISEFALKI